MPVLLMTEPRLAAVQSAPMLKRKVAVQPAGSVLLLAKVVVEDASMLNESAVPAPLVLLT